MDGASFGRPRAAPRRSSRPAVVKSAVRVLEILAYIDRCRTTVTVSAVADALGIPQSSTSALLRSLAATGYLHREPSGRRYGATERVALLGRWVSAGLLQEGPVLRLTDTLAARYGCAASLWTRHGDVAQCLHLSDPMRIAPVSNFVGAMLPLSASAPGLVFLSLLDDAQIRRLMHRLNAEAATGQLVRIAELLPRLANVREQGLARSGTGDCAMVAALLPSGTGPARLSLTISGAETLVAQAVPALLRAIGRNGSNDTASPRPWSGVPAPSLSGVGARSKEVGLL